MILLRYFALLLISGPLFSSSNTPRIHFLVPDKKENIFWSKMVEYAQKAAQQLNVEFTETYSIGGRFYYQSMIDELVSSKKRPDYAIIMNFYGTGSDNLKKLANAGIKVFIVNTDLSEKQRKALIEPRAVIKNWIGHIVPDDFQAGKLLADKLVTRHRTLNSKESKINILAFLGSSDSTASSDRHKGLLEAVKEDPNSEIINTLSLNWDRKRAYIATGTNLRRFKNINVIWTVNDAMALGVLDQINDNFRPSQTNYTVGGIDWIEEARQRTILNEKLITVGNHYLHAAYSVLLISDYHRGIDFKDELDLTIKIPMQVYDKETAQKLDKLDFKKISKYFNKQLEKYSF